MTENEKQEQINRRGMEARMEEHEAALKTLELPPPAPVRKADIKNLARLVRRYDKVEAILADTIALEPRLKEEIKSVLEAADGVNERLVSSMSAKKMMLDMIPFKITQLQRDREETLVSIKEEFAACFIEFERQFAHVNELNYKHLESLLLPLMSEDFMAEPIISRWLLPYTKLSRQIPNVVNRIQHYGNMGNPVAAARELLASGGKAAEILAAAEKLSAPAAAQK